MTPSIVISIDFELRWGVAVSLPNRADAYRQNLEGVRDVVPGMLELFAAKDVGATWATVGALMCSGWDEFFERAPTTPNYHDERLRFSKEWRDLDVAGTLHFAPDLVNAISRAPHQEIGSHTFSHIYLREKGCEASDVTADTTAMAQIMKDCVGTHPTSIVFPRNQLAYTDVLHAAGIQRWRENPKVFYWNATTAAEQSGFIRALRMADAVAPLGSRRAPASQMRASYFIRFNLPNSAWRLHLRRMMADARSLRSGESLHLWWHPHNLGASVRPGLRRLEDLIDGIRDAAPPDARFRSMRESDPAFANNAECG